MRRTPWFLCLWPGLAQLWMQGSWSALGLAMVFAVLVCGTLVGSFVWPGLISTGDRIALWTATLGAWGGCAAVARRTRSDDPERARQAAAALFPQALDHYLLGNWVEVETLCEEMLKHEPRDIEARLLRATLHRRTGRRDEARRELDRISLLEGGERWQEEVRRERLELDAADEVRQDRAAAAA